MATYTRYPRAILWLLREGDIVIGGPFDDAIPSFAAHVDSFYISKEPITNEQFEAFDAGHLRSPASPGDDQPVAGVAFDQARGYCEWYARVSGKPTRLPTEIEWEFACRAGTTSRYYFGDDPGEADEFLWDSTNAGARLPPLKNKRPNPAGLYGMLGGVWEWTSDLYRPYPLTDRGDVGDSRGPRVLRGGSFLVDRTEMGCGVRRAAAPEVADDDVGFRIVRPFASVRDRT